MPNTEVKLLSADCSEGFPFVRVGRRHAFFLPYGGLAQLGEHLPYKQRVSGSSPVRLIVITYAGVAELADALDLGSSAFGRGGSSPFTRTSLPA